jgi:hypothetical protein
VQLMGQNSKSGFLVSVASAFAQCYALEESIFEISAAEDHFMPFF